MYALLLVISALYFWQDFQSTHNYMQAWFMQWFSLRQWVLFLPASVIGVLLAQCEDCEL